MSVGYIPVSEIIAYGEGVGHLEDLLEDFIYIIQQLDEVYIEESNKKNKK